MKRLNTISILILITTMTMNAQKPNVIALNELERHIELGNLSEKISAKLKDYFKNGGEIDDSDWLFFLQSRLTDIEEYSIKDLLKKRNSEIIITTEQIVQILRDAGFILDLKHLDNKAYKILQKELTETSANIALQDTKKAILKDSEADVWKGNDAYVSFLEQLSKISDNKFVPYDINETWQTETGPIIVRFKSWNKQFVFEPEYLDDWIDGSVIQDINNNLAESKCGFYTLQTDYISGQEIPIFFLYEYENQVLAEKLNWKLERLK